MSIPACNPTHADHRDKVTAVIDDLLGIGPYDLKGRDKQGVLLPALFELTQHHRELCTAYRRIADRLFETTHCADYDCLPYLPVNLFKHLDLRSILDNALFRTMMSSGTGGNVSKIYLDKTTAAYQTKVLNKIVSHYLGSKRLPMLVIDSEKTVRDRQSFSARTAAIKGYSIFGKRPTFALNEDFSPNLEVIEHFLSQHGDAPFLVFGFTSFIYTHFVKALESTGKRWQLSNGILVHGGGWKKLQDIAVDNDTFKAEIRHTLGIERVHNYYGMVEQTGSVFFECPAGYFHCSSFSEVLTRRADFSPCAHGEPGLLQVMSVLPISYPGHSLLTEDRGILHGVDNCKCRQKGSFFTVLGRAAKAEVRGCSDVQY